MFRAKIILLSLVISGLVLVGFGVYFLAVQRTAGTNRIDRELLALGGSQIRSQPPLEHWLNFENSLRLLYGDERSKDVIVRVTGFNHNLLYESPRWPKEISGLSFPEFEHEMDAPDRPFELPLRMKKPFIRTIETQAGSWRVGIMGNPRFTLLIAMNLAGFYREEERLRKAFLIAVPVALLLLAGAGWLIVERAMKPVSLITRTAEGITAHALDQRIPAASSDKDLSRLVNVINGMLGRLQKSFGQAVRFSADAAHELQTPLTVLQGELDDAVQHAATGSEEQARYSALLEEVQRLKTIVQKLLVIARSDAGKLDLRMEAVDLSTMIGSAAEDIEVVEPQLQIEKDIATGVIVQGDRDLLRQVIQNLASNAVKYNLEKGLIRFRLKAGSDRVHFTISNAGSPIPPKDRERIFDRFYRADKSRSRAVQGAGLGLCLAREIARAHRGDLSLDSAQEGLISFTLSLPRDPRPFRSSYLR